MGREEGSGWGTQVYLWRIHFVIWQNQYNIVKLKNKIKLKKINYRINQLGKTSLIKTYWRKRCESVNILNARVFKII